MNFRKVLDAGALIVATALLRFGFRSHYLYDIDSVNFALSCALVLGIAVGLRTSAFLVLGALFLYSLSNVNRRQAARGTGALVMPIASWVIPTIRPVGKKA